MMFASFIFADSQVLERKIEKSFMYEWYSPKPTDFYRSSERFDYIESLDDSMVVMEKERKKIIEQEKYLGLPDIKYKF